jgi:hypothetical protein
MGLRAAGETSTRLAESLAGLELTAADKVLVDEATWLARQIDSITNPNLTLRYHAHLTRILLALAKRSDVNMAARVAEERRQEAAELARLRAQADPLARLRERSVKDSTDSAAYERRMTTRIGRLAAKGTGVEEIAEAVGFHPSLIPGYIADYKSRPPRRKEAG